LIFAPIDGAQTSVIRPSGVKWRIDGVKTMSGSQSSPSWYARRYP